MSLPERELTQEARIAQRRLAVLATPELRVIYEAARTLADASQQLAETGRVELAIRCSAMQMHLDKHLGLLWDWREDIRMEPPKCPRCRRVLSGPNDGDNPRGECEACYRTIGTPPPPRRGR